MSEGSPKNIRKEGVSSKTDELATTLLGDAFDVVASGCELGVLLAVQDIKDTVISFEFSGDGEEVLIAEAHSRVRTLMHAKGDSETNFSTPVRYALTYLGAVASDDESGYKDALFLEFGEMGYKSYSAYSYVKGRNGDFKWSEPAPAGEVEPLL